MVCSLVGCCLAVGEGRRDIDFVGVMLEETARSSFIPVAAAKDYHSWVLSTRTMLIWLPGLL